MEFSFIKIVANWISSPQVLPWALILALAPLAISLTIKFVKEPGVLNFIFIIIFCGLSLTLAGTIVQYLESKKGLFVVIRVDGEVGGVAGPVPYGMRECLSRVVEMEQNRKKHVLSGIAADGTIIPDKNMKQMKAMRFLCERHLSRPTMSGKFGGAIALEDQSK